MAGLGLFGAPGVFREGAENSPPRRARSYFYFGVRANTIPTTAGKRYLLSVIADGFSEDAAKVIPTDVTYGRPQKAPLLPAQVSVLAYHDNNSANYVTDLSEADILDCPVARKDYSEGPILTDLFGDSLAGIYFGPNLRKDGE